MGRMQVGSHAIRDRMQVRSFASSGRLQVVVPRNGHQGELKNGARAAVRHEIHFLLDMKISCYHSPFYGKVKKSKAL